MQTDNDTTIVMLCWSPDDYRMRKTIQSFSSLKAHTNRPHTLIVIDNGPEKQTQWLKEQDIDVHIVNEINKGVGPSRNQGLERCTTDYIAFVDNDIGYFPNWLNSCVEALRKYDDRKLIATAVCNHPMRRAAYPPENLDDYLLYKRCAGMCLVMKYSTAKEMGGWSKKSNCGHVFSKTARKRGYRFIWHPSWNGRHMAKPSYHYKFQKFNPETGEWAGPMSKTEAIRLSNT